MRSPSDRNSSLRLFYFIFHAFPFHISPAQASSYCCKRELRVFYAFVKWSPFPDALRAADRIRACVYWQVAPDFKAYAGGVYDNPGCSTLPEEVGRDNREKRTQPAEAWHAPARTRTLLLLLL